MKKILFITSTILFIMISVLCVCTTVQSQEKGKQCIDDEMFDRISKEYEDKLREVLEEAYCTNSGINISYVTNDDGNRNYNVKVHHKLITLMNDQARQELLKQLYQVDFAVSDCGIEISFFD